ELARDRPVRLGVGRRGCTETAQDRREYGTETASHAHAPMLGSASGLSPRCKPMPSRLLTLLLVPVLAVAVAACGAEKTQSADSSTDTSQLLRDTFDNLGKMKSADVNLQLHLTSPQGAVGAQLAGPFVSSGQGKLPRFAFNATLTAAGR